MKKNQGFTLVELLMVIGIIGLIAAASIFALSAVNGRARDATRVADMDQVMKALDLYFNSTSTGYPLAATGECMNSSGTDAVNTTLAGANISTQPIADPTHDSGTDCYLYTSDGATFTIRYRLETDNIRPAGQYTVPPGVPTP